jgi:2-polyprenyl-3-methyl-5-hydroxy-6-metoxy-1,4-benzoquinol methylase
VLRSDLVAYFQQTVTRGAGAKPVPAPAQTAQLDWRLQCYDHGRRIAERVERQIGPLTDRTVLDVACAWGGHALAFAERAKHTIATDLLDHQFGHLQRFADQHDLRVTVLVSSCEQIPVPSQSCDVLVGLELLEHIDSVEKFAAEISRVLRPGGVCVLSTPPRWLSFVWGEPHYRLRFLTLLPFRVQGFVAERFFGRRYPYPIPRQFSNAAQIVGLFPRETFEVSCVLEGRFAAWATRYPRLAPFLREYFFTELVLRHLAPA